MIEIREDIISKRIVVINENRRYRYKKKVRYEVEPDGGCVFCPKNENETPAEITRTGSKNEWSIRVFTNKFPIFIPQKSTSIGKGLYNAWKGHGVNEVIVLTPRHNESPLNFGLKKWFEILKIYGERTEENYKMKGIKYVLVLENHGVNSGATLQHAHAQLVSFPLIPDIIRKEANSCKKKLCCKMIEKELKSNRLIFKNKDFIVFSNYAGRFPFEIHIYPFRHIKSLAVLTDDCIHSLAEALMIAMNAYKSVFKEIDYNMVLHTAPKGKDYHFHIEIYPQIYRFGSVEYGTDVNINTVSPETSAKMLRDALR